MNQLKGNEIPTKKTKGALGDIYTDTSTGKKYKCIFSYRDNDDDEFNCQWKELGEESKTMTKSTAEENKTVVKPEVKEEPKKPVAEEVKQEEIKPESVKPEPKQHNGKTNYAAYSRK